MFAMQSLIVILLVVLIVVALFVAVRLSKPAPVQTVQTPTTVVAPPVDIASIIEAVKAASQDPHFYSAAHGLGTADDPVFPNMHAASARVCGATLLAAQAVHAGDVEHAVNLAGGLHHAMRGSAEGFCIYSDIAVGIQWLLDQGVERIAYVDVDVHHGDGVEAIFRGDPQVLTFSLHESGRTLFPGTGGVNEKQKIRLSEVIEKVNELFGKETTDQDQLSYMQTVKAKMLESETLRQQAASNTKEQFKTSPDLRNQQQSAIMDALDAHQNHSKRALNSDTVQSGMLHLLLEHFGILATAVDFLCLYCVVAGSG